MKEQTAEWINRLGRFCGKRDVPELTPDQLYRKYQIRQADVLVLFGGSILCGGDVLADAMKQNVAQKYVIVGGAGHTTETLRRKMHAEFPEIMTEGLPEAEIFEAYLEYRYGLHADLLECRSTNCGNNITYLLELLAVVVCAGHCPVYVSTYYGYVVALRELPAIAYLTFDAFLSLIIRRISGVDDCFHSVLPL